MMRFSITCKFAGACPPPPLLPELAGAACGGRGTQCSQCRSLANKLVVGVQASLRARRAVCGRGWPGARHRRRRRAPSGGELQTGKQAGRRLPQGNQRNLWNQGNLRKQGKIQRRSAWCCQARPGQRLACRTPLAKGRWGWTEVVGTMNQTVTYDRVTTGG